MSSENVEIVRRLITANRSDDLELATETAVALSDPNVPMAALDAEDAEAVKSQVVTHRFGRSDEIASVVAFVASAEASYINGQDLIIDGGLVAAVPA